jgi:hypothetical protein
MDARQYTREVDLLEEALGEVVRGRGGSRIHGNSHHSSIEHQSRAPATEPAAESTNHHHPGGEHGYGNSAAWRLPPRWVVVGEGDPGPTLASQLKRIGEAGKLPAPKIPQKRRRREPCPDLP